MERQKKTHVASHRHDRKCATLSFEYIGKSIPIQPCLLQFSYSLPISVHNPPLQCQHSRNDHEIFFLVIKSISCASEIKMLKASFADPLRFIITDGLYTKLSSSRWPSIEPFSKLCQILSAAFRSCLLDKKNHFKMVKKFMNVLRNASQLCWEGTTMAQLYWIEELFHFPHNFSTLPIYFKTTNNYVVKANSAKHLNVIARRMEDIEISEETIFLYVVK